ncbi:HAD family hydrolase [Pseudoruegeria sp. HB172150]|uniref:sulfotransferase-like domain-containing protein n=1 Tax=Pseudoruegeria sp. HB172150 TaxID=2721164 RepID=UPI001553E56E|nr:HAD family hydrolase [Pseudoruegeria sp. HB172150]
MRIAMWSGPRNLSTAMMYAFAQRGDCAVTDEPFYAAYLAATGLAHPMREEVLASQPQDAGAVGAALAAPAPGGRANWYQKHMVQHMLPGFPRDWMAGVRHVFLIRHPARVVVSFAKGYEALTLEDVGFVQQAELFEYLSERGEAPLVIDSYDIRQDPEAMLTALCLALGIRFDPAMLSWPEGGRAEDGVWAAHWYKSLHRTTGFAGPEGDLPVLDSRLAEMVEAAMPSYRVMEARKIRPASRG